MSGTAVEIVPAIQVKRTFTASAERIFNAWTEENDLKRWFIPNDGDSVPFIQINVRQGARYRIGIKDQSGNLYVFGGVMKKMVFPKLLTLTWAKNGGGTQQHKTQITIELHEKNGSTELTLTHDFFSSTEERVRYEKWWNRCLDQLQQIISV